MKIRCNFTYIKKFHLGLCLNSHCFLCTLRSLCFAAERQRWPEPCWRAGISSSPPPQDSNGSRMVPAAWFLAAWFLLPPGSLLDPIPARRGPLLFPQPLRHRRVLGRRFNINLHCHHLYLHGRGQLPCASMRVAHRIRKDPLANLSSDALRRAYHALITRCNSL